MTLVLWYCRSNFDLLTDFRKMGDGGFSNIYEVYGEAGTLLALKVCLLL